MSKILYLMRHGETLFNQRDIIQGACDSPLTEKGIQQAKIAAQYFKEHNIQLTEAVSSTQERASDTLELITDLEYRRLKGIKEWDFGVFEGESEDLNPNIKPPLRSYGDFFLDFGGESAAQVSVRMNETLKDLMEVSQEDSNVLAVSHGGAMFVFFQIWEDLKQHANLRFSNCCIMKFEYHDGRFKFLKMINHDFSALED